MKIYSWRRRRSSNKAKINNQNLHDRLRRPATFLDIFFSGTFFPLKAISCTVFELRSRQLYLSTWLKSWYLSILITLLQFGSIATILFVTTEIVANNHLFETTYRRNNLSFFFNHENVVAYIKCDDTLFA